MARDRDAFDAFQPLDRGRFGDNESADVIRGNSSVRSNLVDLKLYFVRSTDKAVAVARSDRPGAAIWLPRSQIEMEPRAPAVSALVTVTMPEWLAREKGLA